MDTCSNFEALRNQLISTLNSSGLTIGGALFVLKDVYNVLFLSYQEELQKEQNKQNNFVEELVVPMTENEEEMENGEQNND